MNASSVEAHNVTMPEVARVITQIYDAHYILAREVAATTIIQDQDGRIVYRQEQGLPSGGRSRFFYSGNVPLRSFPPGSYAFTIEAFTRNGIPASTSQQVRFEVADTGTTPDP